MVITLFKLIFTLLPSTGKCLTMMYIFYGAQETVGLIYGKTGLSKYCDEVKVVGLSAKNNFSS